jgi:uncharacterized protein YdhG (YjbR/CyaY superfamily)
MPPAKPATGAQAVDQYLAALAEPFRSILQNLREQIRSASPPDAEERISYRIPMFFHHGPLVGYAAFTRHCSLFLATSSIGPAELPELASYPTSKGAIRFPPDSPLPAALIRKIVRLRLRQNQLNSQASS